MVFNVNSSEPRLSINRRRDFWDGDELTSKIRNDNPPLGDAHLGGGYGLQCCSNGDREGLLYGYNRGKVFSSRLSSRWTMQLGSTTSLVLQRKLLCQHHLRLFRQQLHDFERDDYIKHLSTSRFSQRAFQDLSPMWGGYATVDSIKNLLRAKLPGKLCEQLHSHGWL